MINKKVTPAPERITKTWFYLKKLLIGIIFPLILGFATGMAKSFYQSLAHTNDVSSATLSCLLMLLLGLFTILSIIAAIKQLTDKYEYHNENKQVAPLYTQFTLYMELRKLYKQNHKLKDYNTIRSLTQISRLILMTIQIIAEVIAVWIIMALVQLFATQSFSDTKVAYDITLFVGAILSLLFIAKILFIIAKGVIDFVKPNHSNNPFDYNIKIIKSVVISVIKFSFGLVALSVYNPESPILDANKHLTNLFMIMVVLIGIKGALMIFDHYIVKRTANMLDSLFVGIDFENISDVASISKTLYDRLIEEKAQYIIDIDTVSLIDDVYINQELIRAYDNDEPLKQIDEQTVAMSINALNEVKAINVVNDLSSKVQLQINFVIKNIGETLMVKTITKYPIIRKTENTIN